MFLEKTPHIDKLMYLIGIELPQTDYERLRDEHKQSVEEKYQSCKTEIGELIRLFKERGFPKGAVYLENIPQRITTNIEISRKTGVIAPKIASLLERISREFG
jgi:hypothetical protein